MLKIIMCAIVAGVTLGIGVSLSVGHVHTEGLLTGLIAITCIAIPISFIILKDNKRFAKF